MALSQQAREINKRLLMRVPVLKLPGTKLKPCLEAVASSNDALRSDVVHRIVTDVYPNFDEKRAFRALVAPALTRLHFARSRPPYFRLAPNGRIWKQLDANEREGYVALVLFDFARVRLMLTEELLPPRGSLRNAAKAFGARMVDRVRGLDVLLRYYFGSMPENGKHSMKVASVDAFIGSPDELAALLASAIPRGRIIAVDEARYSLMNRMLLKRTMASSFVVDEWLKLSIRRGIAFASRAAFAKIDSLTMEGFAINTVTLKDSL